MRLFLQKAQKLNTVRSTLQDEWRKFVSPTCPGPRSAHSVVTTPAGGGKLFLFGVSFFSKPFSHSQLLASGGEFSSPSQSTFHHYADFWCFDISTHSWDRIDTKLSPSPRSGHRHVPYIPNLTPTSNDTGQNGHVEALHRLVRRFLRSGDKQ